MNIKIVFFDVDGTLKNEVDGFISEGTKQAIDLLHQKGIKVVIATGRPLSMCEELMDLGIDTFITANGSYATHNGKVIHTIPMDKDIVQKISNFAEKESTGIGYYTDKYTLNGVKNDSILEAVKETLSLSDFPEMDEEILHKEVYGMCLYADDSTVEKYVEAFPELTFKRWHPYVLDVLKEEVSKSTAIVEVLKYYGFDKTEAMAFGDGTNDIEMIELVGFGVAMGNAKERLKEKANFVTKKSSEDGIPFALKMFGII